MEIWFFMIVFEILPNILSCFAWNYIHIMARRIAISIVSMWHITIISGVRFFHLDARSAARRGDASWLCFWRLAQQTELLQAVFQRHLHHDCHDRAGSGYDAKEPVVQEPAWSPKDMYCYGISFVPVNFLFLSLGILLLLFASQLNTPPAGSRGWDTALVAAEGHLDSPYWYSYHRHHCQHYWDDIRSSDYIQCHYRNGVPYCSRSYLNSIKKDPLALIIAGPAGTFAARLVLATILGVAWQPLVVSAAPGMIFTAITAPVLTSILKRVLKTIS